MAKANPTASTKAREDQSTAELRRELVEIYRSMTDKQRLSLSKAIDRELLKAELAGQSVAECTKAIDRDLLTKQADRRSAEVCNG